MLNLGGSVFIFLISTSPSLKQHRNLNLLLVVTARNTYRHRTPIFGLLQNHTVQSINYDELVKFTLERKLAQLCILTTKSTFNSTFHLKIICWNFNRNMRRCFLKCKYLTRVTKETIMTIMSMKNMMMFVKHNDVSKMTINSDNIWHKIKYRSISRGFLVRIIIGRVKPQSGLIKKRATTAW